MDVSARCAAGSSGCAPCYFCRHGYSASIPHAFEPTLSSGGGGAWPSPATRSLAPHEYCRTGTAGLARLAPRRTGRGLWGYAPACCGRLSQSVPSSTLAVRACTSRRTVHRHATRPRYGASTPRLKPVAAICGKERSRLSLGCWPCQCQGASR